MMKVDSPTLAVVAVGEISRLLLRLFVLLGYSPDMFLTRRAWGAYEAHRGSTEGLCPRCCVMSYSALLTK